MANYFFNPFGCCYMIIKANWGYPVYKQPRKWMPCEPPPSFSCMIIPPILTQPHSWCVSWFSRYIPKHVGTCASSYIFLWSYPYLHFQISFLRSQKWLLPHVGIGLRPGPSAAAVVRFFCSASAAGDRRPRRPGRQHRIHHLSGVNIPFLDLCSQLKSEKRIKKGG